MAMRTCEICKKRKKDVVLRNTDQNECQQCYLTRGNTTNQQYQDQASETVTQVATQTDTPIPDEVSNQESTCTLVNEQTSPKRRLTPEFSAEQPSSPVYTTTFQTVTRPKTSAKTHHQHLEECQICNDRVEGTIECSMCCKWMCILCAELNVDEFLTISKNDGIKFFCAPCLPTVEHVLKENKLVDRRSICTSPVLSNLDKDAQVEDHLFRLDSKIANIEKSLDSKIANIEKNLSEIVNLNRASLEKENNTEDFKMTANHTLKQINENIRTYAECVNQPVRQEQVQQPNLMETLHEYNEREKRKMNLVVYGLPENGHAPTQLRNVCQALNIPKGQTEITNCTRLGLMNHTHNQKPRPLLITLKTITMKRDILSKAKTLRTSVQFNKVFIAPDMTPAEREQNRRLTAELKQRRQQGEYVIIKRGEVMSGNPPRQANNISFKI